jgi:hypothetical protein
MLSQLMADTQRTERDSAIHKHKMRRTLLFIVIPSAAVFLIAYTAYALIDPLPPRQLGIAAGPPRSEYDSFAKEYARILARHGVVLEVRNSAGAVENLQLLHDPASGMQAALTNFGFTEPSDTDTLYSLGGIFDSAIYVFYRGIGNSGASVLRSECPGPPFDCFFWRFYTLPMPSIPLPSSCLWILRQRSDALIAGEIDVAVVPRSDEAFLQRLLQTPGIGLMNVVQAEALSKNVPGLKHVVLSRGLVDLSRDIPNSDIDLLASRNRLLVKKDLHPALQLLLEAMRQVHRGAGPFNRLDEFPAEQLNDLTLSPTAQAF